MAPFQGNSRYLHDRIIEAYDLIVERGHSFLPGRGQQGLYRIWKF